MPKPLKILQASAGSGKTFSLTAHYLTLLLSSDNKYREILAVTFTNKATEEMKTRILEVLHGFATGSKKVEGYRAIVLKSHPQLAGENLKAKADLIYRKILHDYSRFSISTIDGFVQKIIRSFAFELGLDSNYALEMNTEKVKEELVLRLEKQLDENETILNWIIELALDRINNDLSWNYKQELTNLTGEIFQERYQVFEEAIQNIGFENIDELFKNYVEYSKLDIEKFKNSLTHLAKQAQEIFELSGLDATELKGKSRSPLLNLAKIAKEDFSKIEGLNKLIDEPEAWGKANVTDVLYNDINPLLIEITQTYQKGLGAYNLSIAFNKNVYYLRLIQEIALILKDYREETGNLLISDTQKLLNKFVGEMGQNPSFIMEKMGQRYKNFLFDEFQDTSENQWNTFNSLLSNAIAEPSQKLIDHLVVGDTKQAIYRWRNGDWNILHTGVKNGIGPHNVVEETLEENYRSSQNIIEFNNKIYQALPAQIQNLLNSNLPEEDKNLNIWWQENKFNTIVTEIYNNAQQNLTPFTPKGGTVKVQRILPEEGNAEQKKSYTETEFRAVSLNHTVEEIKFLIKERGYRQNEICVLVRKNAEALETVEALMLAGLDVVSGEALMIANNRAIKLIVNTLRVLIGTVKNTALYKANCISLYAQIHNRMPNGEDLYNLDQKSLSQLGSLLPPSLCESWFNWMLLPLPELVENLIESYGLGLKVENTPSINLPYLLAFRDLISRATKQGEKGISAFLNWWDEDGYKKALPSSETANAVQVVTVHKSKGLAYRAVFIPFCNWSLNGKANSIFWVDATETPYKLLNKIPLKYTSALAKASVNKAYYEELLYNYMDALNTLYVATTRCKDYLYINTQGKATATVNNVSDLLIETLLSNEENNGVFELDDFEQKTETPDTEEPALNLDSYPTSTRLSELFIDNLENPYLDLEKVNQSSVDGRILHEILSLSNTLEDLETVIYDFIFSGIIKDEHSFEYLERARSVLNQPDIKALYQNADKIVSERTIIDTEGKSHRPDKLIFKADEVSILDFKFTKKQDEKHIAQVNLYADLIAKMGYKNIKGYLYYEEKQSLIAVIS